MDNFSSAENSVKSCIDAFVNARSHFNEIIANLSGQLLVYSYTTHYTSI